MMMMMMMMMIIIIIISIIIIIIIISIIKTIDNGNDEVVPAQYRSRRSIMGENLL